MCETLLYRVGVFGSSLTPKRRLVKSASFSCFVAVTSQYIFIIFLYLCGLPIKADSEARLSLGQYSRLGLDVVAEVAQLVAATGVL